MDIAKLEAELAKLGDMFSISQLRAAAERVIASEDMLVECEPDGVDDAAPVAPIVQTTAKTPNTLNTALDVIGEETTEDEVE